MAAMKAQIQIGEEQLTFDVNQGQSLSRPLDFGSSFAQFGADPPRRTPLQVGAFVGDTKQGGGCNVDRLQLVPHCHGTHTETVGHIVHEEVTLADLAIPHWLLCAVVSVTPAEARHTDDSYTPQPAVDDLLVTEAALATAWDAVQSSAGAAATHTYQAAPQRALIVRCQETPDSTAALPPYFSSSAIRWCQALAVDHLLVELPSIDRVVDEGLLTNHHLFWQVPEGTHTLTAASAKHKTITELIDVNFSYADGIYLLNLQVPEFQVDAAPSRPVIFPLLQADR